MNPTLPSQDRSYDDGRFSEKNYPESKIEFLMDRVWDLASDVRTMGKAKKKTESWDTLIKSFENLRMRTKGLVKEEEKYELGLVDDPLDACDVIEEYLEKLQEKDLFRIGEEDMGV